MTLVGKRKLLFFLVYITPLNTHLHLIFISVFVLHWAMFLQPLMSVLVLSERSRWGRLGCGLILCQ